MYSNLRDAYRVSICQASIAYRLPCVDGQLTQRHPHQTLPRFPELAGVPVLFYGRQIALYLIELSNIFYLQGNLKEFRQNAREGFSFRNSFGKIQKVHILVKILRSLHLANAETSARLLSIINKSESDEPLLGRITKRDYSRYTTYLRRKLGEATFDSAFAKG